MNRAILVGDIVRENPIDKSIGTVTQNGVKILKRQADKINAKYKGGALDKFVVNEEATEEYYLEIDKQAQEMRAKLNAQDIAKTGVADALLAKVLGNDVAPKDTEREELVEAANKHGIKIGRSSNDTLRKKIEEAESKLND